jgi:hypothetical protein
MQLLINYIHHWHKLTIRVTAVGVYSKELAISHMTYIQVHVFYLPCGRANPRDTARAILWWYWPGCSWEANGWAETSLSHKNDARGRKLPFQQRTTWTIFSDPNISPGGRIGMDLLPTLSSLMKPLTSWNPHAIRVEDWPNKNISTRDRDRFGFFVWTLSPGAF